MQDNTTLEVAVAAAVEVLHELHHDLHHCSVFPYIQCSEYLVWQMLRVSQSLTLFRSMREQITFDQWEKRKQERLRDPFSELLDIWGILLFPLAILVFGCPRDRYITNFTRMPLQCVQQHILHHNHDNIRGTLVESESGHVADRGRGGEDMGT